MTIRQPDQDETPLSESEKAFLLDHWNEILHGFERIEPMPTFWERTCLQSTTQNTAECRV